MIKRNVTVDIAKGIGIICVVLAHAGTPRSSIVVRFHMALFFFLAGMVADDKYIENLRSVALFIWKRIKGLYIPFVLFNGAFYVLYNYLIRINVLTTNADFLLSPERGEGNAYGIVNVLTKTEIIARIVNVLKFQGESQLGGALWFLRVLFEVTCTWCILNYILKSVLGISEIKRTYVNIIVGILYVMLAFSLEQREIYFLFGQYETVMASYLIYFAGNCCRKYKLELNNIQYGIVGLFSFFLLCCCNKVCSMTGWSCSVNHMGNPYMFLLTSSLGISAVYFLSKVLENFPCSKIILVLGQNSLAILLFHFAAFKFVTVAQCYIYHLPLYRIASFPVLESGHKWWIIYTLVGLFIPLILSMIYKFCKKKVLTIDIT